MKDNGIQVATKILHVRWKITRVVRSKDKHHGNGTLSVAVCVWRRKNHVQHAGHDSHTSGLSCRSYDEQNPSTDKIHHEDTRNNTEDVSKSIKSSQYCRIVFRFLQNSVEDVWEIVTENIDSIVRTLLLMMLPSPRIHELNSCTHDEALEILCRTHCKEICEIVGIHSTLKLSRLHYRFVLR